MSNRSLQALYYNVSVIGLSGVEDVRGTVGVGKSCLCNRFVRPDEDSYYSDHIYMLSQSDFGGEVINNVPWLYWGETNRQHLETDQTCIFRVIEQTEFIDDTAFTVLSCGTHEPYAKRCLNLKLRSARKLVYICKDQLGVEDEYPKDYLPEGKITIDGFIYAFDVSNAADRQLECLREILSSMPKVQKRRPFIIATTKNDIASDDMRSELDRFFNRKEIRNIVNNVTIVETSASEGVNVDSAFMALASLIEKSKTKPRILSYFDAARARHEEVERLKLQLHEKMLTSITSHRSMWREWSQRQDHSLQEYFSALGSRVVKNLFDNHVSELRKQFMDTQKRWYLNQLPKALDDLLSTSDAVQDCTTEKIIQQIRQHERFGIWFINSSNGWENAEAVERGDPRIPVGILNSEDGRLILIQHSHKLEEADTRNERRKAFLSLLRRKKSVKAGKRLPDVIVFLAGDDCFDGLSVPDRMEIFSRYQEELIEKSKAEFHELLLERADLFFHLAMPLILNGDSIHRTHNFQPSSPPPSDDDLLMRELCSKMQNDAQYRNLDCLPHDRQQMILTHLMHFRAMYSSTSTLFPVSPDSRPSSLCAAPAFECPASPCVQSRLFEYLSGLASRITPSTCSRPLFVIGHNPLSSGVASILREKFTPFPNSSFEFELHTPAIVVRPEVSVVETFNRRSLTFPPKSVVLMVYRDAQSIAILEHNANLIAVNRCSCVVLHLCDASALPSEEVDLLKLRGGQLACQVEGVFAEMLLSPDTKFRHRSGACSSQSSSKSDNIETLQLWHYLDNALNRALLATPKITVILAFMCSDLYPLELVMKSIVNEHTRFVPWKQRLYIGEEREIVFASYFQLLQLLTGQLPAQVHGLILVFWTARKASLESMQAVCNHCPVHWPKLVVGVGVDGREDSLQGGQDLAHEMEAHFAHIQPEQTDYRNQFEDFLKSCSSSKVVTEDRNRQLMGAPARRPANHPSTLPAPPIPNVPTTRHGHQVQRRKSSAGSSCNTLASSSHAAGNSSCRKSWHSSNSSHDDNTIYSVADPPCGRSHYNSGVMQRENFKDSHDCKRSDSRDFGESLSSQDRGEDEYATYEDLSVISPHPVQAQQPEMADRQTHSPLSQLDNNSLDAIYAEPLDIHALGSNVHQTEMATNASVTPGHETTASGGLTHPVSVFGATGTLPFSDAENEYAEVEGYHSRQGPIQHFRICVGKKRSSPPPPTPYPRSTSEADPRDRRFIQRHTSPEYDEPACEPESPLASSGDGHGGAMGGGSATETEESSRWLLKSSEPEFVRNISERRSQKESKKKAKGGLTSSKSFGGADRLETKKSRGSAAQNVNSSSGLAPRSWRSAFRSSAASAVSPTRGKGSQDNPPRTQPPPHTSTFVATCTEYVEKHGLKLQGIYRQCGNRTVAETIRQRSKEGNIKDWLHASDVTAHDVATALKLYLQDLPEPVMPLDIGLYKEIAGLVTLELRLERLRRAIFILPPANQRLLSHLLRHLHKVTGFSDVNDMTASNLAICWTPTLAIPHNADMTVFLSIQPIQELMALLIEHADLIFQAMT